MISARPGQPSHELGSPGNSWACRADARQPDSVMPPIVMVPFASHQVLNSASWLSEPLPDSGSTFPSLYHGWPVCGLIVPWLSPHCTSSAGASASRRENPRPAVEPDDTGLTLAPDEEDPDEEDAGGCDPDDPLLQPTRPPR